MIFSRFGGNCVVGGVVGRVFWVIIEVVGLVGIDFSGWLRIFGYFEKYWFFFVLIYFELWGWFWVFGLLDFYSFLEFCFFFDFDFGFGSVIYGGVGIIVIFNISIIFSVVWFVSF